MTEFLEVGQQWCNTVLIWIGFGTVVGLIARAIMPGRDQGGTLATLLMGIGGSIVGLGTVAYFWEGHRVTPVSVVGFLAALAGASLLLLTHRMLQGSPGFLGSATRDEATGQSATKHKRHAAVAASAK